MESETEISPKNLDVNANPVFAQPQSRNLWPQSRPMTSMHISTMSPQLAITNAAVTNPLKSNTINTQSHNATLTQPQLDSQNQPHSVQPKLMHTFNTTENQANKLFLATIRYDAKQNEPQTLATPLSCDQLKEPKKKTLAEKKHTFPSQNTTRVFTLLSFESGHKKTE